MIVLAAALALTLCVATGSVGQDKATRPPAPKELTAKEGTAEGHKTPLEVAAKAIKAAKADQLATVKACLGKWAVRNADDKSWDSGAQDQTNLQAVATLLAAMEADGLAQLEQNSVGNYAVVVARRGDAMHLIRTVREAPEKEDADGKKPHNWMLATCMSHDYRVDYNAPGVKAIRDAIGAGDTAKLKECIDPDQTRVLDLLADLQEGVDPYALLIKRLQKIIKNSDKPRHLLARQMSGFQNVMAFWFHAEGADTFLVLNFIDEWDWETKKHSTKVHINLDYVGYFHRDPGDQFKQFVSDYDWG
jgi:hypothetical protein